MSDLPFNARTMGKLLLDLYLLAFCTFVIVIVLREMTGHRLVAEAEALTRASAAKVEDME